MDFQIILRWIIGLLMIGIISIGLNYALKTHLNKRPRAYIIATILYFGLASVHLLIQQYLKTQKIINDINNGVVKSSSWLSRVGNALGDAGYIASYKYAVLIGFGLIPIAGLIFVIFLRKQKTLSKGHLKGVLMSIITACILFLLFIRL